MHIGVQLDYLKSTIVDTENNRPMVGMPKKPSFGANLYWPFEDYIVGYMNTIVMLTVRNADRLRATLDLTRKTIGRQ